MPHNRLRREINKYLQPATTGTGVVPHTLTANNLLKRALAALGGPVAEPTPPQAVAPIDAPHPADVAPALNPITGHDPGDETDHVTGLGEVLDPA